MTVRMLDFVANTPDDNHCLQASFSMVYSALTGRSITMDEAETLTGFVPDMPTWQFGALLSFAQAGLIVRDIEHFSPSFFVEDPEASIRRQVGNSDVAESVLAVTDLDHERAAVAACLKDSDVHFEDRLPELWEVDEATSAGGLVICTVNSALLAGKEGWVGHAVVVSGTTDEVVTVHDPGIPPLPNRDIPRALFTEAWCGKDGSMANLIVVREPEVLLEGR